MLDEILRLPNGAHFYRADLHTHTPADPGFHHGRFNTTTEEEKQTLAREYVRYLHEEQQIDIVAITDHNDVGWIKYIQEAAADLYPHTLTVFPGVELGANEGKRQVHFLALFNPNTNPDHIDHFISSLGLLPHNRFHDGHSPTPRLTQLNTRQLTQRIVSGHDGLPGLPIAAHATRKNGLLHELEGEGRVLAYEDPNLIALEIPSTRADLSNFVRRLVNGEENYYGYKSVACLNSSDGRSLAETNNGRLPIGGRATRIKLSTFSIEALRHALIDHDSRIRLEGEHSEQKFPRLLGLTIHNGFLSGNNHLENQKSAQSASSASQPTTHHPPSTTHQSPFRIHFNPNLNTIIGGRGSGKSSLLEALRFVFDLPPRTQSTANQHTAVINVTLPKNARVTAYYELTDGSRYQISRRPGQTPDVHAIQQDNQLTKIDIHPSALLPGGVPLEVYGQKEVYEIANDPQFQLNLIDSFIATQLNDLTLTENDLLRDLQQNAQAITQLQAKLTEAEQQLTELPLITHELTRLEQDTTLQTLQHKKQLETEKHTLTKLQQRLDDHLATIQKSAQSAQSASSASKSSSPILTTQTTLLQNIETHIQNTLQTLQQEIQALWDSGEPTRQEWQQHYEASEADYQALLDQHGDALSIERYFDLQKKKQTLEQLQTRTHQQQTELETLSHTRTAKLNELHTLRYKTAFTLRQQKAADLTTALHNTVRIQLTPAGNRSLYFDHLKELFSGYGISKKVIEILSEADLSPTQLAAAIRTEQTAAPDDITPLHNIGITPAYRRKLEGLPEPLLYNLETYRIPDLPDIALKVGDDYRSLTPPPGVPGLSMGQKCTAVLSIILVERNTPLIIDQPEDDLDNAFIFREIVQTLRREKERRQFIIATHNANIPVSGDAELILLMQANEQHGWIAHSGSIDDPQIREPVENILEGGREAFQLRQSKYAIPS